MQQKQSNLRDFDVLGKLGEGAFGQVFKVKRKADGKEYALKKIKIGTMKPKEKENALNEVRILASYDHEFIIGYKEAFYDENSAALCVIMEFAAGGDVLKLNEKHQKSRSKYQQEEIWTALVHMATGLKSLHDKKVLHRDLKCANVFITADKKFKLGDLNVSKVLKKDFACTQTGTPYYASPQVWKDQPYNLKSDMWSLGCVLYEMAALRPPFTAHDLSGLYKKICTGIFDRIPYIYSSDLQTVISSLLQLDPKKRPDTEQLLNNSTVLKHFTGKIDNESTDMCGDDFLLQTIKFNPRDLQGLKKHLPKANYEDEEEKNIPKSCRSIRKEPENSQQPVTTKEISQKKVTADKDNEMKLKEFLQKKRELEEKQRHNHLQMLKQQNQQLMKKKERVLSACGVRNAPQLCESPRIAVHKKDELPPPVNSCKPTKKDEISLPNARLPPKPQGLPNYKLPPRPNYYLPPQMGVNKSTDSARDSSKQNLRNIGARLVGDNKPAVPSTPSTPSRVGRSSSAQKILYPCWWG